MSLLERFTLQGNVALITGAGKGIGKAIALAYAEAGASVVCAARTLADVEAVAEQIRQQGGQAIAVSCDVNDPAQREAAVARTLEAFGKITHLVNNAGGGGPNSPLKLSWEEFDRSLHFNVTSAYHLIQLCAPHMLETGQGNIINITSGAARYIQRNFSRYDAAAKAALTHLGKMLAQDFAPLIPHQRHCARADYDRRPGRGDDRRNPPDHGKEHSAAHARRSRGYRRRGPCTWQPPPRNG